MRASWSWLLVLAACTEHDTPADALNLPDCICTPAQLASDHLMMDFGSVAVSSTSPASTIQISNIGFAESGAIAPVITGSTEFTVANGCSTLSPSGTCVMAVAFKPTTAGTKMGTLIVSSSPGGTVQIALTGVAQ